MSQVTNLFYVKIQVKTYNNFGRRSDLPVNNLVSGHRNVILWDAETPQAYTLPKIVLKPKKQIPAVATANYLSWTYYHHIISIDSNKSTEVSTSFPPFRLNLNIISNMTNYDNIVKIKTSINIDYIIQLLTNHLIIVTITKDSKLLIESTMKWFL